MATTKTTVVHLKKAKYDLRIDRGTIWGNPFKIGEDGDRQDVLRLFKSWVKTSPDYEAQYIRDNVHKLRGMVLGCWCHPLPCHGDILAKMADS